MKKPKIKEIQNFEKVEKITKTITTVICIGLGAIFLAACVYMLNMINDTSNSEQPATNTPQNMSLANM